MSELSATTTATTSTLTLSVETQYVTQAEQADGSFAATYSVSDRPDTMIVAVSAHYVNAHGAHDWLMPLGVRCEWSHDGQTATARLVYWSTDAAGSPVTENMDGQLVQFDLTLATLA